MSSRDVWEVVLEPMRVVYLPPRHLRHAPDGQSLEDLHERALGEYVAALERFDRDTLDRAWAHVRKEHGYAIWPVPGAFERAAEALRPRPLPPGEVEVKRRRAHEMAEDYAGHYLKRRKLGRLAREQGWQGELRRWVAAAAFVQAQLLLGLGRDGIAWDSQLAPPGEYVSGHEAFAALRRTLARPLAAEKIDVGLPPETLVESWRERARDRRERPADPLWQQTQERLRERVAGREGRR